MTDERPTPSGRAEVTATADPTPAPGVPVMMTDAYVEIGTANLSCFGLEVHILPENKPIELTTFCGVKDYPGPTKWHLQAKLAQSFDVGSVNDTLMAALEAYQTDGTLCPFRVRAFKSRAVAADNPSFEGNAIPQPYELFGGAAGEASEVDIDWIMDAPPTPVTT